ncbi:MAG: major capsid protein [Bacteroidales bacterium]|nr:major capsid protein [Bacteroidales bacterium]
MDTFAPATYFDVLSYALRGNPARLQDFVDAVLADYNVLNVDGFSWNNDLLDDFTYEQLESHVGIAPLANVVDPDSPAIPFARQGESLGTGKIPRMKTVDYLNEAKVRALKKLIRRRDVSQMRIAEAAGAAIAEIIVDQTQSFVNAISFQRDQMVSKAGVAYNSTNNPYGISLNLSARVPSANTTTLTGEARWWKAASYATEGGSSDPVQDMKDMVEKMRKKGVSACHFEINNNFLDKILGHSEVKADLLLRLGLSARFTVTDLAPFNRDEQISALSMLVGKPIVAKDRIANVEYSEGGKIKYREIDSFATDVVVLVPDGNIGEILTVEPLLFEGGQYAFGLNGKLAFTIEADYTAKCQSYSGELTSVCAPNKPKLMLYLKPCEI